MLLDKTTGTNSIVQDKYATVSVVKKNIEEARNYFSRISADLITHFGHLGSKCIELDATDRLLILHDFFRAGEKTDFHFDLSDTMRKGHDFRDYICLDTFEFEKDYFRMGSKFGRVIFLREYASYIKDSMVSELCDLNRNMMLSLYIIPIPTDEIYLLFQHEYSANVDAGNGLIKVGSSLVSFIDKFPRNTKLYKLMTTKPGE